MAKSLILERKLLVESIVVNPDVADMVASSFAMKCRADFAQEFMRRRVRQELLRREDLQYTVPYEEVRALSASKGMIPQYVQDAMDRGEPLFRVATIHEMNTDNVVQFFAMLDHLCDWMNALNQVAARTPQDQVGREDRTLTLKAIENLKNQTIDQALKTSEAWYARMGARAKGEKDGVITIMRWPDGFYAVQFKPDAEGLKTMRNDGNDLQNCLRSGNYEGMVKNSTLFIYAIRRPNDEAVVGIAINPDGSIRECKGKQNAPVSQQYAGYTAQFLTKIGAKAQRGNYDLERAEISYANGKFTYFHDGLEQILDQPNVKVWKSSERVMMQVANFNFRFAIEDGKLQQITKGSPFSNWNKNLRDLMQTALNAAAIPPDDEFAEELAFPVDLYFKDGKYGTFEDVTDVIYNRNGVVARSTDYEVRFWTNNDKKVGFTLHDGHLDNMSAAPDYSHEDFPTDVLSQALNDLKIVPNADGLATLMKKFEIDYKDGRYGSFRDIARVIYDRNGIKTWATDSRILSAKGSTEVRAVIRDRVITILRVSNKNIDPIDMCAILNTFGGCVPAGMQGRADQPDAAHTTVSDKLFGDNIVYTGTKYSTVMDAAELKVNTGVFSLYSVHGVDGDGKFTRNIVVDPDDFVRKEGSYLATNLYSWHFALSDYLIDVVGRRAAVKMANAIKYDVSGKDGEQHSCKQYGIITRQGPGNYRRVEVKKPVVLEGEYGNLYQLSPSTWAVVGDTTDMLTFRLRDGKLTVTNENSQYWSSDPFPAMAVRWIAQHNDVIEYDGIGAGGLLDMGNKKGTTFEQLIEKLKSYPNDEGAYIPFLNIKTQPSIMNFFTNLGGLTVKQQAILYTATKPKAPFFQVVPDKEIDFDMYGKQFKEKYISLPVGIFLVNYNIIKHPELVERISNYTEKAVQRALTHMEANKETEVYNLRVGGFDSLPGWYPRYGELRDAASTYKREMSEQVSEAERADDKNIREKKLTMKDFTTAQIMDRYRWEVQLHKQWKGSFTPSKGFK